MSEIFTVFRNFISALMRIQFFNYGITFGGFLIGLFLCTLLVIFVSHYIHRS